ncbi:MAG: dockerin type I repeat-containing protein [Oscillospiraceae bacterium]|nr:dockerin type I repeat-containing protein [Oscillospiraceae bacterium]
MKKKISAILAGAVALACLPLQAYASENAEWIEAYPDWCSDFDFDNYPANLVITGAYYSGDSTTPYEYSVTDLKNYAINPETGKKVWHGDAHLVIGINQLKPYLENAENLKVGDLLYIPVFAVVDVVPGCIHLEENYVKKVDYIGNGQEIFGEDFIKAVRNDWLCDTEETYMNPWILDSDTRYETFDIVMGDATDDNEVDIIDVITMNKTILGQKTMSSYAQYVCDINKDNIVDPIDSLAVMEYIIGLIDTLES